jgi:hypothetical protein
MNDIRVAVAYHTGYGKTGSLGTLDRSGPTRLLRPSARPPDQKDPFSGQDPSRPN